MLKEAGDDSRRLRRFSEVDVVALRGKVEWLQNEKASYEMNV